MNEYIHGGYASIERTQDYISPSGVGTLPVYFGRAPVHQLADPTGAIGVPVLVNSWGDAAAKLGYSDKWESYELSEAVYAHFRTSVGSIGPIVCVNVLDPAQHRATTETAMKAEFSKGRYEIMSADVILSTVAIAGKEAGVDFAAEYATDGSRVILRDLRGAITGEVDLTYWETNVHDVRESDIVDAVEKALPLVYQTHNKIPTLLCAPGWSAKQVVAETMLAAAQKINSHWYAYCNLDLPCDTAVNTIDKAIAKKADSATGAGASLYWPKARKGTRVYHLSTLATVRMQQTDYDNDNLPYESPSNKPLDISGLCLEDGTAISYDKTEANRLNAVGVGTAIFWGGRWVLWGPHTSLYQFGVDIDPKDQFDCSVRMLCHLANEFQARYGNEVDKPMKRSRVETISNDFQATLDSLTNQGALLLGNIRFDETSNPVSDMVTGDFVFDLATTTTPPAKSLTVKIQYTTDGLSVLFGGDDNG